MNKHNAKKFLPIIQALADGEEIECKCIYTKTWKKQENICFDEEPESYRIKPEPRTFDVWRNEKTKRVLAVEDGDHDKDDGFSDWKRITVMEVLK